MPDKAGDSITTSRLYPEKTSVAEAIPYFSVSVVTEKANLFG